VTTRPEPLPPDARPPSLAVHDLLASRLRIVWEDDDIVVVDKPSGMPSVPARTPLDPADVAAVLAERYGPLEAVHRLDRDTSGLLVLARSRFARVSLGRAFESSAVSKRYHAVVHGVLPSDEGVIHLPLADDRDRPPRKRVDPILGRRASTRWRVCETRRGTGSAAVPDERTLVALEPITGRSHQLRVHLAWLGCPIVGDPLYGRDSHDAHASQDSHDSRIAVPMALRAVSIAFPHPRTGQVASFTAAAATCSPWDMFSIPAECWWPRGSGR
jgi:tRNA pseudouridine32 synthase/23S rRNA pseudouridine746 synthase